ncbi:hypothetical protein AYX14_07165 [Cryptococcus neoformans]|nr:hypothetical protein AYX14_07165 [Cryptococcus neoformans var. grubii]
MRACPSFARRNWSLHSNLFQILFGRET